MDDTTETSADVTYSEAEIAAAQDHSKALRVQLNALPYRGEGDPAREQITKEINRLASIAYAEPPVRWRADGPSAGDRAAAQARLPEVHAELATVIQGSDRHMELLEEKIALIKTIKAPGATPLSGLPWNVRQAPLREEVSASVPVELAEIPPLGGNEQWRLEALGEVRQAAEKAGRLVAVPALLAVAARGHREGQSWNEEKCLASWRERGHTPEQIDQIAHAARTFNAEVLGPKLRAQLTYLDQFFNPELIERGLKTWGRWPL